MGLTGSQIIPAGEESGYNGFDNFRIYKLERDLNRYNGVDINSDVMI